MERGFKGLIVWQKAYLFALEMYKATENFPKMGQCALTSQMRRAAVSVSGNISEGYERKHRKEYVQFLMIAKGSLGELETYLMFARDLCYLSEDKYARLKKSREEVIKILKGLIKSLTTRP